jgi:hypothetical protein
MSYTAVPTKSTGELWTAANHNMYIKDNFAAGVPDIFTTKGDIAVATAADTATRLAVGTDGQFLVADSGESCGIKWSTINTFVGARYKVSTGQTISNGAITIVNFDSEDYDTDSAVTTGAAWKFTVPVDMGGYYLVTTSVFFDSDNNWAAGEVMQLLLYKNNALVSYLGEGKCECTYTGLNMQANGSNIVSLDAADYINIRIYQSSGVNQVTNDGGTKCYVAIAKLF